ncbi:hypothetical protein STAFG_5772 [Streptomyces afghaniensis 772]|uniref:Uncharacterized protein n=1 Tax=Streptomyces afghaniensis 772 TaxID=1283301 RepID=S4MNJ5_9ACTN|nr:hypothetical protein STAFG_5772 [Streptomyces afghaniensis 772]
MQAAGQPLSAYRRRVDRAGHPAPDIQLAVERAWPLAFIYLSDLAIQAGRHREHTHPDVYQIDGWPATAVGDDGDRQRGHLMADRRDPGRPEMGGLADVHQASWSCPNSDGCSPVGRAAAALGRDNRGWRIHHLQGDHEPRRGLEQLDEVHGPVRPLRPPQACGEGDMPTVAPAQDPPGTGG